MDEVTVYTMYDQDNVIAIDSRSVPLSEVIIDLSCDLQAWMEFAENLPGLDNLG